MTTAKAQTDARNGTELGDLRTNNAQAAAEGELSRAERVAYVEAVKARAVELYCAGLVDMARELIKRELGR